MIHKLLKWLPAHLAYGRPVNWATVKDFNLTGCVTTTKLGSRQRHLIAITYSRKDHMCSVEITLFFVCFGIGRTVTPRPAKPY